MWQQTVGNTFLLSLLPCVGLIVYYTIKGHLFNSGAHICHQLSTVTKSCTGLLVTHTHPKTFHFRHVSTHTSHQNKICSPFVSKWKSRDTRQHLYRAL